MPYQIPQQIAYKERILFGLTFGQLLYALAFLPVALALFFKTPYNIYVRVCLVLIPVGLCALFMFTNALQFIRAVWEWLFFREIYLMDFKMQNFLGIKKVGDEKAKNFVQLYGRKVAVLKVEPINFSIKNSEEKTALINSFQKLLNALEFPIQIVIGTTSLNLDLYINALESRVRETAEKTGNEIYSTQFQSYRQHLISTIKGNSTVNRLFYLVIPEQKHIGLEVQTGICLELLKNLNLKAEQIQGEELTQTLTSFFNDLLADEDKTPFIDKPITEKSIAHYTIAPKCLLNYSDCVQAGDKKLCRTIAVKGYPRMVEAGFLDRIVTINGDFDLALHIEPFAIETMMVMLNKELQKQRADLYSLKLKQIINPSLEIQYSDTKKVLENLQKGNEKLFNISLYITCKAKSEQELDLLTKKIESELNALMMLPSLPLFRMHKGLKSTAPFGIDILNTKRNITTKALSAFFPFTSQFLQIHESGVWLGNNKNNVPVIKDIFTLTNYNGAVLASSGAGKSYFTKLLIARLLLNGTRVMIVDPQSEYIDLIKQYDGQVIEISRSSETVINPLDLMGSSYADKRLALMDLLPVMIGVVSEIQKSVLDRALTRIYEKKGITNEPKTWANKPPLMEDLVNELQSMSKKATVVEKETYRSLINRLSMYATGVFSFMNRHTKIDFDNSLVGFVISDMPKPVQPVQMFLILEFVYSRMRKDRQRKLLVIDEAWSLLGRAEDNAYIFEMVKTARKFNLALLLLTQEVADLVKSDAGNALLSNSSYTLLLRQKAAVIDDVTKTFQLSPTEKERLLSASVGEGILLMENEHTEIKIIASPQEHQIITTNPDELLQRENIKEEKPAKEQKEVKIDVDEDKGFYKKSELNEDEIKYLLGKDYVLSSHVGLEGGRRQDYLLKPAANESPAHFFLVKAIEHYLRKYTKKIWLYATSKPDIVFEAKGKKIAVEVETGNKIERDLDHIKEKVAELNKQHGKNWFFVLTEWTHKKDYQSYGTTLLRNEVPEAVRRYFQNEAKKKAKKA